MVRRDLIGSVLCALAGAVLCALPHAVWLAKLGEPVWVADQDELYYLGVAAQAYGEHPLWLGDPTQGGGHSLYQGLPLLPGIWIVRLLGVGPALISLVWRCWGGGLAGLAWYGVIRCHRVRPLIAAAAAIVLLTDAGMLEFRPLLRLAWVAWQVISGHTGGSLRKQADDLPAISCCDALPDDALSLAFYWSARLREKCAIVAPADRLCGRLWPSLLRLLLLLDGGLDRGS